MTSQSRTPLIIVAEEDAGTLRLTAPHSQLEFARGGMRLLREGAVILTSGMGWGEPTRTLSLWQAEGDSAILTFTRGQHGFGRLRLTAEEDGWRFRWDQPTRDTFDLSTGVHWYGQGEILHQLWPLERMSLWEQPLITWDNGPAGLGNIQTPMWFAATGVGILAENPEGALSVGLNAPPTDVQPPAWDLSFGQAPIHTRPYPALPDSNGLLSLYDPHNPLEYVIVVGTNAPSACRALIRRLGWPDRTPPEGLLREPIWTTWARYKMFIDQEKVIAFAKEIRANAFPGGTLEIDDKWQRHYGDTAFDPERFPDPAAMVAELKALGFNATLWIVPFFSPESPNAREAAERGYLVRNAQGHPYEVTWWQGVGYLLDVSNPNALAWWAEKLRTLQTSAGLAGFKFDAGEAAFLPADAILHTAVSRNEYSQRWVRFAAENFPYCEARCGWRNHTDPILFRQWDRFSTWGLDNGLHSIITSALSLSVSGYPFTMPDMIGGNAYGNAVPDKELIIRWTQASAPMLAIQFSIAPWDFDAETVEICRKYAQLHVDLAPRRLAAANRATQDGEPPIKPIFWGDPLDLDALQINSEYLLGDDLLVAPVVEFGARSRNVYLPAGQWRDYWSGAVYGAGWLMDYPAPLDKLPLFEKIG